MSKALVIKGAYFAANKVGTIAMTEVIPCTEISITPTTVAFETIGATQQITSTLTPANTNETVYYVSSNTDVATVSGSGLITCVGIGSAVITVICGTQSATCAVSLSSVVIDFSQYAKQENKSVTYNNDYAGLTDRQYGFAFAAEVNILGGYKAFYGDTYNNLYPIPIPKGATKIVGQCSASLYLDVELMDSLQPSAYRPSASVTYSALKVTRKAGTGSFAEYDFSGFVVDGFVCSVYRTSNPVESDLSETITLTFS